MKIAPQGLTLTLIPRIPRFFNSEIFGNPELFGSAAFGSFGGDDNAVPLVPAPDRPLFPRSRCHSCVCETAWEWKSAGIIATNTAAALVKGTDGGRVEHRDLCRAISNRGLAVG